MLRVVTPAHHILPVSEDLGLIVHVLSDFADTTYIPVGFSVILTTLDDFNDKLFAIFDALIAEVSQCFNLSAITRIKMRRIVVGLLVSNSPDTIITRFVSWDITFDEHVADHLLCADNLAFFFSVLVLGERV